MPLTLALARERAEGECRTALVPETAKKFSALGARLRMEQSAGAQSHFLDTDYAEVDFAPGLPEAYASADLILRVTPPSLDEIAAMPEGAVLIGLLKPFESRARLAALNEPGVMSPASSPFMRAKPPKGNQFSVKSVPS